MTKLILIDGDILTYQIGFSVEAPVYICEGRMYTSRRKAEIHNKGKDIFKRKNIGSFNQLELNLKMKLKTIFEDIGTNSYKMYITSSNIEDNFRFKIATYLPYKGNRKQEKPFYYKKIRDLLINNYKAELIIGQEADDFLGIEQYKQSKKYNSFEGTCIASIDKDLLMLEGYHYNMNNRVIQFIDKETALKNFYGQLLKGDPTDNIPGLSRLLKLKGRKEEANRLSYGKPGYLKNYTKYCIDHCAEECYDHIIGLYESYGFGREEITEIGQLLWIRREEDELWLPKK